MAKKTSEMEFQTDETIQPLPDHVEEALGKGWADPETGLLMENADDLLKPGYLPLETGCTRLPDGKVQVACLTKMPGCKGRMINWWFGWMANTAHYKLWHPKDHVWMEWEKGYPGPNNNPDDANYVGYGHLVHEFIGGQMNKLRVQFKKPSEYLDTSRFEEANVGTAICARAGYLDKPLKISHLIHLVRDTKDGCEMRSRFWAGDIEISIPVLGSILGKIINTRTMRNKMIPENLGSALLIHCAEEMNHLAGMLPELYQKMTGRDS